MKIFQKTLKKQIAFEGISLHSGLITKINLLPAKVNQGIIFKRIDLKNSKSIPALWKNVKVANLCTVIKNDNGESVSTIEHLMFAFYVTGITNVTIEVDGPEIPILDGSSKLFVEKLNPSEIIEQVYYTRQRFYERLKTFETFGKGWTRRNKETLETALEMADG